MKSRTEPCLSRRRRLIAMALATLALLPVLACMPTTVLPAPPAAPAGPTPPVAPAAAPAPAPTTAPARGPKAVKTGTFYFPRMMFHVKDETGDWWNVYPVADVRLRKRLTELTNINASQDPVVIQLSDLDKMCRYPFIFATSEGYFDIPKDEQKNLKEYLLRGGFIHADDCVHHSAKGKTTPSDLVNGVFKPRQRGDKIDGDRFFSDHLKNLQELLPEHSVVKLPNDHELYHCYFDFPDGCPHLQGVNHGGWGLIEKGTGRIMSLATPGDLHCEIGRASCRERV
jgi:hypothetical protein